MDSASFVVWKLPSAQTVTTVPGSVMSAVRFDIVLTSKPPSTSLIFW
jgi:hypothetical protein